MNSTPSAKAKAPVESLPPLRASMSDRHGTSRVADARVVRARQIVADFHSANPVPGASVAVFDSSHILFEHSVGVRAAERPEEAMTGDTVFRLYSLTKMITALAAVRLADAGRLRLDDTVGTFFPSSACIRAPMREVTIRQLLSHTSGLYRGEIDLNYGSRDAAGLSRHILELDVSKAFLASPGDIYSYSDEAFAIVGYAIERSTGRPFADAIRELVFEPLGMDRACFDPLAAMTLPLSQQHVYRPSRGLVALPRFADSARMHPYCGAFCSARDLCRFGMLHLGHGLVPGSTKPIISADAIREMRNPVTSVGLDIDLSYGLGAYVGPRYGEEISYGHEGYYLGSWCKLVLCPGASLGLAWCDNRGPADALITARLRSIRELLTVFGAGEPSWEPAGPQPGTGVDHAEVVGRFRGPAGGSLQVHESAGQLHIADSGGGAPLVRHRGSLFVTPEHVAVPDRAPWKPHAGSDRCCVCFVRGHDGSVSYLSFNGIAYRRVD
jgi:CubicO group peptidase (beta-lactamase class C family)